MTWLPDAATGAKLARHARASRRLRLSIDALIGDARLARSIERTARRQLGVVSVAANPRSGRVLIEYADAVAPADLERLVRNPRPKRHAPHALGRPPIEAPPWHAYSVEDVVGELSTSVASGLSARVAEARLAELGANLIAEQRAPSRIALLAGQVANLPTALLIGSTVVSLLLGDVLEALAIATVVGLNVAIGYHIERRSEDLLAAWRVAEAGSARVMRDGLLRDVSAADLVPGDLLVVRAGDVVSADARIVDAQRLAADEAALTGESEPVDKHVELVARDTPLPERTSLLFHGTAIASGHGRAIVVATGAATELASVQRLAAAAHAPQAQLQRRLNWLASRLAWSGLAAAAASGIASLLHGRDPLEIVRDSVALGVAAIPEGLPVTATAALVRAMARMRERGVVVRRLATAATLGAVTALCTDKTGTLTENRMRVEVVSVLVADRARRITGRELAAARGAQLVGPLGALIMACVLNSDVDYQHTRRGLELAGSSTERALVEAAQRFAVDPCALRDAWPRSRLVERHDNIQYVISEHARGVAFVKGAPEQVLPLCALDRDCAERVRAENAALADAGLRVLAFAWQAIADRARVAPGTWHYVGLVGLRDPLRDGSADAVRAASAAGIRTIVLTGDQRATAAAIAAQADIAGEIIDGKQLRELLADGRNARARLARVSVVARVAPADKVAVINALRRQGEIVAMAGDGINDAPALRAADVGIAVGARSNDLARQTADVVLEREDLRSILEAVAEGRAVQDNLRRSIRFQAAGNFGELLLVLGASTLGRRLIPSLGLLWINLLTDTLPGLALALEPVTDTLLDRPPLRPDAPILDLGDWRRVARDGALIASASGVAAIVGGPLAAFAAIGATQFGYAAACRAPGQPLAAPFAAMVGGSAALHLFATASAPARSLLRIPGPPGPALVGFGLALAAPLFLAWRRHADHEITRHGNGSLTRRHA